MVSRRVLVSYIALIIIAPLFGVVLANQVGYHEPLDTAAEELGLNETSVEWTPLSDYSVPGLDPVTGYIVSGFIGVGIILLIGYLLRKIVEKKK